MIDIDRIPEADRVCVNCVYFIDPHDGVKCGGVRPCLNYSDNFTENFFIPDDDYLQSEFGCDACSKQGTRFCEICSRNWDDMWEGGAE